MSNLFFFFFFLIKSMGKKTLEQYYSKAGGAVVAGADVLIESPTPGEARTSKFIDFRISPENTSAGTLNHEETSVLVKLSLVHK